MIYGANGYTGELIANRAREQEMTPILAGRDAERLRPLAEKLKLPLRVFGLLDPGEIDRGLSGVDLVLHCAGPFSATARPMVDGCLRAGAHYLDITGEITVFEANFARAGEFERAGIVVLSGVGFDVVPTDCLAVALHRALPDATSLELAFGGFAKTSKGTAKTMVEGLPKGGMIRREGMLVAVPSAHLSRKIRFADKERLAMAIPWGDVSTAFHTTGIPNITVFMGAPAGLIRLARFRALFRRLFERPAVQSFLKRQIEKRVKGPDEEERRNGRVQLWGRVENAAGQSVEAVGACPEGYTLTVEASLECVRRLLRPGHGVAPGVQTPAGVFGAELLASLNGCDLTVLP